MVRVMDEYGSSLGGGLRLVKVPNKAALMVKTLSMAGIYMVMSKY